jgi:hypothetical protein
MCFVSDVFLFYHQSLTNKSRYDKLLKPYFRWKYCGFLFICCVRAFESYLWLLNQSHINHRWVQLFQYV